MDRTALLALTLLCLPWLGTGCSSAPLRPSPFAEAEVAAAIRHERGGEADADAWVGPSFASGPVQVFLRGSRDAATGATIVELQAQHSYRGDWLYYDGASDLAGEPLRFTRIRQHIVVCHEMPCGHAEWFGVEIPAVQLEQAALVGGLRIRVHHRAGHQELYVPAGYAKAFVAAVLAAPANAAGSPLARNRDVETP